MKTFTLSEKATNKKNIYYYIFSIKFNCCITIILINVCFKKKRIKAKIRKLRSAQ